MIAVVLIVVGALVLLTGELIGVFSKQSGDTITDWWVWLRDRSPNWWLVWVPFLSGVGWLVWHFAVAT